MVGEDHATADYGVNISPAVVMVLNVAQGMVVPV